MDTLHFYGSAVGRGLLIAVPLVLVLRLVRWLRPDWFPAPDPTVMAAHRVASRYDRALTIPTVVLGVAAGVGTYWLFRGLRSAWEARMPPHIFLVRDPAGQADVPFEIVAMFTGILGAGWACLPMVRLVYGRAGAAEYMLADTVRWRTNPLRIWGRLTLGFAALMLPPSLLLVDHYLRVEADRIVVSDYLAWRTRVYRFDEVQAVVWQELTPTASRQADGSTHEFRIEFADGDRWRTQRPAGLRPMAAWVAARAGLAVLAKPAGP